MTTSTWGIVRHLEANTSCGQLVYKIEDSSFSRSGDISAGVKSQNVSRDHDHTPFRDDLSLSGLDLLPLTYRPNVKFLTTPITKIWRAVQNVQIVVVLGG